ncbi:hypothetical protein [Micromonospora sp. NPDC005367]|uniref:hypothetical protein n=1 Tax=Micromonospora sp. NPDC005367 TaxID=3155590 RepID=UPI0033BEA2D0
MEATVVDGPSGRPRIDTPGTDLTGSALCADSRAALEASTPIERKALAQLNALVKTCLARRHLPEVRIAPDWTWPWAPGPTGPKPDAELDQEESRAVRACVGSSRREQLLPYVAPPALGSTFTLRLPTGSERAESDPR